MRVCVHLDKLMEQVVFMKTPDDTKWSEIGRTEVVANNLSPRFVNLIAAVRARAIGALSS